MSERGVAQFISIVGLHFPRPKFSDDEVMEGAWMASMTRALSGYDDDVLGEAAQKMLSTRVPKKDGKFFPVPAECSAVCDDILYWRQKVQTPLLAPPNPDTWSDERLSLAFDLCKGELGRRAAREGWIGSLFEYCRKNMEIPRTSEQIAGCIAVERELRGFSKECTDRAVENPSTLNKEIAKMAKNFIVVREDRAKGVA